MSATTNYRKPLDAPPVAYTSTPSRPLQPGDPGYVEMDGKPWRPSIGPGERSPDERAAAERASRLLAVSRFAGSRRLVVQRLAEIDREIDALLASFRNSGDEAGADEVACIAAAAGKTPP